MRWNGEEWPTERVEQLQVLWAEGISTAEIGRRMNLSKNAVVGKAHRLGLPSRPSPIKRSGDPLSVAPKPMRRAPTLPALKCVAPVKMPDVPVGYAMRSQQCCWPFGDPKTPAFHYCDAPGVPGKPYCPAHAAIAYVRVPDRQAAAA